MLTILFGSMALLFFLVQMACKDNTNQLPDDDPGKSYVASNERVRKVLKTLLAYK